LWDILPNASGIATPSPGKKGSLGGAALVFPDVASPKPLRPRKSPPIRFLNRKDRLIQGFALIASLESGQNLHLGKEHLRHHIFAISIDDSLYIASPLVSDPSQGFGESLEIRRVRGNIGRPGLNLLGFFSPLDAVRMRGKEPGRWKIINHYEFDGRIEDFFSSTSLHLGLTGYVRDIAIQGSSRFSNTSFVEAVVSCHDAGHWVADLDLFNGSVIKQLIFIKLMTKCRGRSKAGEPPGKHLLSIENWEELLDPPPVPVVFRAHGNWQARLAGTFICLKNGYLTLLFGGHGCWDCAFKTLSRAEPDVILRPIKPKSQSPSEPGREEPESSHSIISHSEFEQDIDVLGKDLDIPDTEPLKEDSSSDLAEPVSTQEEESSVQPLLYSKEKSESTVMDTASAVNSDRVHTKLKMKVFCLRNPLTKMNVCIDHAALEVKTKMI
jgi:hypothetical protein